jgi:alpha-ribazole phosphatase
MGTPHSMDVYLVRHGVTRWNVEKRYLGHSDEPLIYQECNKLNPLKNELENIPFNFCFSSDLKRCTETFHYLLPHERVCLDSRLRELHFGDWEGLTYEILKTDLNYQEWLKDWEKKAPPNGESLLQLNNRINAFLAELFTLNEFTDKHNKVLIVTHGGVIRSIMQSFRLTKMFWDLHVQHAKAFRLSLQHQRGRWVCNSWSVVPIQEKEN